MPQYLYHNGSYCLSDSLLFSEANRSFRYGDNIFESMVMFHKKIPFLPLHWQRMTQSLQLLNMQMPEGISQNTLAEICLRLSGLNGQSSSGRIRVVVYRQNGGLFLPGTDACNVVVTFNSVENSEFLFNQHGLTIVLYPKPLVAPVWISSLKTGNALPYIIAAQYAKSLGADLCLMLNTNNHVAEADNANIFCVHENRVFTPPVESGCIDGVMRKVVIQTLAELNMEVNEVPVTREFLEQADELFLTNATQGIRWAEQFESHRYSNQVSYKISKVINSTLKI